MIIYMKKVEKREKQLCLQIMVQWGRFKIMQSITFNYHPEKAKKEKINFLFVCFILTGCNSV